MFSEYLHKKRNKRSIEIHDITEESLKLESAQSLSEKKSDSSVKLIRILIIAVFFLLASRIFYLQIVRGEHYAELSRENRIRGIVVKAPRGIIFDRNGKKMVQNIPGFDLVEIPADLPRDADEKNREVGEIGKIFEMNETTINVIIQSQDQNSLNPVLIKENVSQEEALVFQEKKDQLKGFMLDKTAIRQYMDGDYFSSIIGYNGKITKDELAEYPEYLMTDSVGKAGLEYSYEKYLHGEHGKQEVEVDSSGEIKKNFGIKSPTNGSDLVLGIDYDLQKKIYDSLKENAEEAGTKTAAAVAVDPRNGEILALVNLPSYDNNLFTRGISNENYKQLISDENKPMFNRSISGEYPPGSTFKPLVAAAALQEKIINSGTSVNCSGGIRIGSYSFPDWKTHGITDVRKAIAESCDVFFYSIGGGSGDISGLGIGRIKKYADLFGLGRTTGIDIPGETTGLIPDAAWKEKHFNERWYVGDDYHCAIGQGFVTASPLQLANYTAAIANGGTVYVPHLVRSINKPDGSEEKIDPQILNRNFISPSNMEIVKEGMNETVSADQGSGKQLADLKVQVAGKTGTAQFGTEGKTHGWFISFAPYDNPEIAMVVLVEGGGEGHSTAVPVTKEVYKWYFEERK